MNRFLLMTPVRLGISNGALVSVIIGLMYVAVWHESGSLFYPFAGLAFMGGPLVGGITAARKTPERKGKAFVTAGGTVFGLICLLFVVVYVVLPQFMRTSVDLTAFRDETNGRSDPPFHLRYTLPDGRTGIRITSDGQTAVVVVSDDQPPYPSSVFLVNQYDGKVMRTLRFANDVIAASIAEDTLVLYNDKIGYLLNARTGDLEESFLLIDNYGGLSERLSGKIRPHSLAFWGA
jgi:hypothetical protein